MFVYGGVDSIRNSETKVKVAEVVVKPLSRNFSAIPDDTEALIKINGAVQVGAGVLLATGKFKRLASLALIGSIVPTTYAGHRFWEEADDDRRKQQMIHFLKNLGLLGGLILELDSPRKTSRSRKQVASKRAAVRKQRAAVRKQAADKVRSGSVEVARKTRRLERRAERRARKAAAEASKVVRSGSVDLAQKTKRLERRAQRRARTAAAEASKIASRTASEVSKRSHDAAKRTGEAAGQYGAVASDRAGQLISYAQDQLSHLNAA